MAVKARQRRSSRKRQNPKRSTPVAPATPVATAGVLTRDARSLRTRAYRRTGWFGKLKTAWGEGYWKHRDAIHLAGNNLLVFLDQHRGWVPMSWVTHITKASRSTIHHAVKRRALKSAQHVLPSGHVLILVPLEEAIKFGNRY